MLTVLADTTRTRGLIGVIITMIFVVPWAYQAIKNEVQRRKSLKAIEGKDLETVFRDIDKKVAHLQPRNRRPQ